MFQDFVAFLFEVIDNDLLGLVADFGGVFGKFRPFNSLDYCRTIQSFALRGDFRNRAE